MKASRILFVNLLLATSIYAIQDNVSLLKMGQVEATLVATQASDVDDSNTTIEQAAGFIICDPGCGEKGYCVDGICFCKYPYAGKSCDDGIFTFKLSANNSFV